MQNYTCLIGRFGSPACDISKFITELKLVLPENIFPWSEQTLVFLSERTEINYVFDTNMQEIAKGYEDSNNEIGFLSLISMTYNFDTFSASDGLYGKVLLYPSESRNQKDYIEFAVKVLYIMENHIPIQEGQKVKIDLTPKNLPDNAKVPSSARELWMKGLVEYDGNITQHILFGTKGGTRKVHVFRRIGQTPTYENTPFHDSPDIAPFVQMGGTVFKDGVIHGFHLTPKDIKPNKEDQEEN